MSSQLTTRAQSQVRTRTPMRCPLCKQQLDRVQIRELGTVAPHLTWEVHAGLCPDHGWFQAEIVGKPPREIFAVTKPFGMAKRVIYEGKEYYGFETAWNALTPEEQRKPVDPLTVEYWEVDLG